MTDSGCFLFTDIDIWFSVFDWIKYLWGDRHVEAVAHVVPNWCQVVPINVTIKPRDVLSATVHNVRFVQYDSPVSKNWNPNTTFPWETIFYGLFFLCSFRMKTLKLVYFLFSGTRKITFGKLKIGQNNPEIANLEFESHGFLENHVFLPTKQTGTNRC